MAKFQNLAGQEDKRTMKSTPNDAEGSVGIIQGLIKAIDAMQAKGTGLADNIAAGRKEMGQVVGEIPTKIVMPGFSPTGVSTYGDLSMSILRALTGPVGQSMTPGVNMTQPLQDINNAVAKGMSTPIGQMPDFYQKGAQKALGKLGEQHVMEAVASGKDPLELQNHPMFQSPAGMMPQEGPMNAQPSTQQPLGNIMGQPQAAIAQQQNPQNVLGGLLKTIFNPGGVDANGVAQAPSLLGGLIQNRNPQDMLARQQAVNATPEAQINFEKRKAAEIPLSKARTEEMAAEFGYAKEKLAIEGSNALALKIAEGGGMDANSKKKAKEGMALVSDLDQVEQQYNKLFPNGGGTTAGLWEGLKQKLNFAQDVSSYENWVDAEATKLGKFIGEDRFTEQDRKVFKKLFPNKFTRKEDVAMRFAMIRSAVNSTINAQNAGQFSTKAMELMAKADEARKEGHSEQAILEFLRKSI